MKLTGKVIPEGYIGPSYCILSVMPTDNPKIGVYLLGSNTEGKHDYSLWNIETSDEDESFSIWPYKGEDYEVLKIQLEEDYIEHALDDF